jgi:hypothetical protein
MLSLRMILISQKLPEITQYWLRHITARRRTSTVGNAKHTKRAARPTRCQRQALYEQEGTAIETAPDPSDLPHASATGGGASASSLFDARRPVIGPSAPAAHI